MGSRLLAIEKRGLAMEVIGAPCGEPWEYYGIHHGDAVGIIRKGNPGSSSTIISLR